MLQYILLPAERQDTVGMTSHDSNGSKDGVTRDDGLLVTWLYTVQQYFCRERPKTRDLTSKLLCPTAQQ